MSLYVWNYAPVVGTDISCSLLVTGREFNFPIEFSTDQHQILTSNPLKVSTFAVEQAGHFYIKNNALCFRLLYLKNALSVTFFINKKSDTLRHIFMCKEMHRALRFYI